MNFQRVVKSLTDLFHRKPNKPATLRNGCCTPVKKLERKGELNDRVLSNWTEHDEREISLSRPEILAVKLEESKKQNIFDNARKNSNSIKIVKFASDFPRPKENSWLPTRGKKMFEAKGGPKRPGLLRAEPITLKKPRLPVSLHEQDEAIVNANFVFSSSSQSSEYYDDRSSVFGGWLSERSGKNSRAKFSLNKLGSSDTERDYGGEEGAKPFGRLSYGKVSIDSPNSRFKSYSEGPRAEENRRPRWSSENDDLPEVIIFSKPSYSLKPSSSVHSQQSKRITSEANPPPYQDFFLE